MRSLWRREDGATAVEMAFVLVVALPFMLGMVDFARAYWNWNSLALAVNEGGRYAMINSTGTTLTCSGTAPTYTNNCGSVTPATLPDCTAIKTTQTLVGYSASDISLTLTCATSPATMTLRATYQFNFTAAALLPFGPLTLSGETKVPLNVP